MIKPARSLVVGHKNIQSPILVKIGDGQTKPVPILLRKPDGRPYIGKRTVAIIAVKTVRLRVIGQRRAVPNLAGKGVASDRWPTSSIHRIRKISHHIKVQIAITVQVGEGGTRRPAFILQAGFCSQLFKSSIAFVAIQSRRLEAGNIDIRMTIAVVIAYSQTLTISAKRHSGFLCHIHKLPIALILIKLCSTGFILRISRKFGALTDKDIELSILIEIDQSHTTTHRLHQSKLTMSRWIMSHRQA